MIYLDRFKSDENGTFGMLTNDLGTLHNVFTIELPWLDNHPDTSCIPAGLYQVEPYLSPKHGDVWRLMNVPGRSAIEIHPANDINDLRGCIGVGNVMGTVDGLSAVLNSQNTFAMLKRSLPSSFQLTISGL